MTKAKDGVVLLHGLGRTSGSMVILARRLERAGYRTRCLRYASLRQTLARIADGLKPQIAAFADDIDGDVHFVTHSLGGLVVRALLNHWQPQRIGRVVMLAPPHGGSEWVDVLDHLRLARYAIGPTRAHLVTNRSPEVEASFGAVTYPLGIIAGDKPIDRFIAP
jgi:triacylglycerol esterase/lipase EstA (alpha/beta hydrolase family)